MHRRFAEPQQNTHRDMLSAWRCEDMDKIKESGKNMAEFTAQDLNALREDISDLKGAVKELVRGFELQARLEERQKNTRDDLDRAFNDLRSVIARVSAIELAASARKTSADWLDKGIWGALVVLGLYLAKKVGLT